MKGSGLTVGRLLAVGGLAVVCSACWPWAKRDTSGDGALTAPEARLHLIRARRHLYLGDPPDPNSAALIATQVIDRCQEKDCVWDAYLVKTNALHAAGERDQAAETAHAGIESVLISQTGAPSDDALAALKTLLPVYVENVVVSQSRRKLMRRIEAWQADLRHLFQMSEQPDEKALAAIENDFKLFCKMAEQKLGSRPAEREARGVVHRYVRAFNAADREQALALAEGGSPYEERVRSEGPRGFGSGAVARLHPAGSVVVTIPEEAAARTTAVCDVLATTEAGYAELVRGMRFVLVEAPPGGWKLHDIVNHP
ncbi:MAG: nuclear transport factor 2 family protein [bacterium]